MSEYLTKLRSHIDAVKGKPFEEKMRRAEMFEELYEYAKKLEDSSIYNSPVERFIDGVGYTDSFESEDRFNARKEFHAKVRNALSKFND
jgi:hypothetical protein